MPAYRLRITGSVQGVSYRATAVQVAKKMGVKGWIRNCDDGSVEAHVEGDQVLVDRFIAWCNRGPEAATVEAVEIKGAFEEGHAAFETRRV